MNSVMYIASLLHLNIMAIINSGEYVMIHEKKQKKAAMLYLAYRAAEAFAMYPKSRKSILSAILSNKRVFCY